MAHSNGTRNTAGDKLDIPEVKRKPVEPSGFVDLHGFGAIAAIYRGRIGSEVGYWLRTIGYDVRDHSVSNRVYKWYLLIFGAFWIFGMWAIAVQFASSVGNFLSDELRASFVEGIAYAVAAFQVFLIARAAMDIPLKLSFKDMEYIAVSPVSRAAILLIRYLWTSVSRVIPYTVIGTVLVMAVAWRFTGDVGGIAGLEAFLILIPISVMTRSVAWIIGMLPAIDERFNRQRFLLWVFPVIFGALVIFVPSVGLFFGNMVSDAARAELSIVSGVIVSVLAIVTTVGLIWLGQKVNMVIVIDDSQTFARVGELGLMAFTAPDVAQKVRQQVRLASRPARERLPMVPGQYMLITRALIHFARRPISLVSQAAWGAVVAFGVVNLLVLGLDFGPVGYAAAAVFMILTVPRGITEVFSIDMNEPFLRRMIPAGNLQLLLIDSAVPLTAIILGASVTWVVSLVTVAGIMDITLVTMGVLMIVALSFLLLMCRGLSLIESKALPLRFEFLPTILICLGLIVLGGSIGGLPWAVGTAYLLVAFLSQFVAITG